MLERDREALEAISTKPITGKRMTDSLSPATPAMTELHTETMKRLLYGGPFPTKWRDALIEIRDLVRSLVSGDKATHDPRTQVVVDRAEIERVRDDLFVEADTFDSAVCRESTLTLNRWLSQSEAKQ